VRKEALMDFRVGDPVIHWTYGLGEIVGLEERALTGETLLYYVVQVKDVTVFVPADSKAMSRLRPPTAKRDFHKLFDILSGPGEPLSEDRFERKAQLRKELADGKAETICRVIRDLSSYEHNKQLNDEDKTILKRAWNALLREWEYVLSVPVAQVEIELQRLLSHPTANMSG
jgi:RNA polymerase-interacting CarD/CdnL/TRCF family regulator